MSNPPSKSVTRVFKFGSTTLSDPNPQMTPEQVRDFYAPQHPALLNAGIGSPVTDLKAGTVTTEFITNYGRKG